MSAVLWGLLGAWLGLVALGAVLVLLKAVRTSKETPWKVGPEDPDAEGRHRLALVIPARDEAGCIERCVRAALAQDHEPLRVVVLDDGSTDGTSEILAGLLAEAPERLVVISGGQAPLPAGWKGKPWACQRAAEHALRGGLFEGAGDDSGADWLLFVDADVTLHPRAAAAALGYATRGGVDLLSGLGTLELVSFWEQVVQPAVASLVVGSTNLDKANDPEETEVRPLANGQFILTHRAAYEAVGGHAAVADNVLDDVGLAAAYQAAGVRVNAIFMRRLFSCRMYDSFGALWEGWTKNLFVGMEHRWSSVGVVFFGVSAFVLLPWGLAPLGLLDLALGGPLGLPAWVTAPALVAVLAQLATRIHLDRVFEQDIRYAPTMPLGFLVLLGIVLNSAIQTTRGTRTWKGRVLTEG